MNRFILDASVVLAWFVDDPLPPYAARVRESVLGGARAVVPALWHLEVANGLAVAERRRILTAPDIIRCLTYLEQLLAQAIEPAEDFVSLRQALTTARTFGLSAYDGVYLHAAGRERLPLATLDQHLRRAAAKAGIELFR